MPTILQWFQHGSTNATLKNVSPKVRQALKRAAKEEGRSLNARKYLTTRRRFPCYHGVGGFCMGPVGVQEMMVIFLVALVLFGPKKLPELGKTIGKAITEFRRAQSELKATFETHMRELEKESESIKDVTRSYTNEIYNHYTGYDNSYYDSGALGGGVPPSTEANPSTVSVPATQGAESSVSPNEPQVNGTVARGSQTVNHGSDPDHPVIEHAAARPVEPESINT